MHRIFCTVLAVLVLLTGCTAKHHAPYPDYMEISTVKNEELVVFRCGDGLYSMDEYKIGVERCAAQDALTLADGGIARITADVDYYDGGGACYLHHPNIRTGSVKDVEVLSVQEIAGLYSLQDMTDAETLKNGVWLYGDKYVFIVTGVAYVYDENGLIGTAEGILQADYAPNVIDAVLEETT